MLITVKYFKILFDLNKNIYLKKILYNTIIRVILVFYKNVNLNAN